MTRAPVVIPTLSAAKRRDLHLRPRLLVLVAALIVACDNAPSGPTRPVDVTSVDTLHPGQLAHVHGSGLTSLRSLLVDGFEATELVASSDSVAEFRVPSMRACETDMRAVKVSVDGSAPIDAVVRAQPSFSLSVAESRVLTEADLHCLRLPAADQDYVLSAANLQIPTEAVESLRMLVYLRLLGTGESSTAAAFASADAVGSGALASSARDAGTGLEPAMTELATLPGNYSDAPIPFDPRYATAVEGDTLRFVDWFSGSPDICNQPAESVPSFQAKVVAVSGRVAVVVDLRHPSAPAYLDPTTLGWLRDAAAMTDRLLLPTMRSLFDPDYVPPAGGGGRYFLMLHDLPPAFEGFTGFAYDGPAGAANIFSQASCPRSSEMAVASIAAAKMTQPEYQTASYAGGIFLHEYAHNADLLSGHRGKLSSILTEGLATLAEETASRIASGQPLHARHSLVGTDAPALSGGSISVWGTQPQAGPWQSNGRYGTNARMLLFLRELAGEASVDHGLRPTLYQRLYSASIDWLDRPAAIAHITSTLGISYADLIDRQTVASVTAGLIDPGVVHDLPRYTAWDHSERALVSGPRSPDFTGRVSRRVNGATTLAAADGGHAALYLMADGPRGISLELLAMAPVARIVRLTRLR